ncbi:MAG TPA: DUF2550 family protein [Jatrophihabitans sp.]|uniref:DUF2550 family protein n=1 Tax=Jatrophihabitans sp. TaxID=1932789 RepID=UPI002EEFDE70
MAEIELSVLIVVCVLLVCGLVLWVSVVLHQRRVVGSAGGLPMALKRDDQRWSNGVGRYAGDELIWYRTLSLSPKPALRMPRSDLEVILSRPWDPQRDMALRPNLMIAECRFRGSKVSLGFPDNGLTGFLSWLEASAPRF